MEECISQKERCEVQKLSRGGLRQVYLQVANCRHREALISTDHVPPTCADTTCSLGLGGPEQLASPKL